MATPVPYLLSDLIDGRNSGLYATVSALRPVEIHQRSGGGWGEKTEPTRIMVFSSPTMYPCAAFAHELLHAKLELAGCRSPYVERVEEVGQLVAWLWNQLAHERMFPQFLALGYPAEQFLNDDDDREVFGLYRRDLPGLKRDFKKGGRKPIRGLRVALMHIVSRSPHQRHMGLPPVLAELRRMADAEFLAEIDKVFADWGQEAECDVTRVYARLFRLCGDLPNVSFSNYEDGRDSIRPSDI